MIAANIRPQLRRDRRAVKLRQFKESFPSMFIRLFFAICLCLSVFFAAPPVAPAQGGGRISIIRDAEIENTIRYYAKPLFDVAGLDVSGVRIHLVLDDRLNAFVAGGQRIFIHTGLLRNAES
ncbi:MAG: peptidase, partial [Alphaproteobacteria bacterium]